jgi:CcmD family protein
VILAVTTAEKYVAAAYGVVFLAVLIYVLIIALKLARLEREVAELTERLRERGVNEAERREEVPVG